MDVITETLNKSSKGARVFIGSDTHSIAQLLTFGRFSRILLLCLFVKLDRFKEL